MRFLLSFSSSILQGKMSLTNKRKHYMYLSVHCSFKFQQCYAKKIIIFKVLNIPQIRGRLIYCIELYLLQLQGEVDDCSCKVENLDSLNNRKVYPVLKSLLQRDYFRYFKVIYKLFLFGGERVKLSFLLLFCHKEINLKKEYASERLLCCMYDS